MHGDIRKIVSDVRKEKNKLDSQQNHFRLIWKNKNYINQLSEIDNSYTDKNTTHSYLPLYNCLLEPLRETATNVLEVGIGDFDKKNGGSLLMWRKYFTKAIIYGLDILPQTRVLDELIEDDTVILYTETNAYDKNLISNKFKDKRFDFLIDDGPHTLDSQIEFIKLYSPLLSDNGILIVEDVQCIHHLRKLEHVTPENLKPYIKTYDLRNNKKRYDDIVFVIDKVIRS